VLLVDVVVDAAVEVPDRALVGELEVVVGAVVPDVVAVLVQNAFATGSILDDGMMLPGNGRPVFGSLTVNGRAEKSPLIMACVGANRPESLYGCLSVSRLAVR